MFNVILFTVNQFIVNNHFHKHGFSRWCSPINISNFVNNVYIHSYQSFKSKYVNCINMPDYTYRYCHYIPCYVITKYDSMRSELDTLLPSPISNSIKFISGITLNESIDKANRIRLLVMGYWANNCVAFIFFLFVVISCQANMLVVSPQKRKLKHHDTIPTAHNHNHNQNQNQNQEQLGICLFMISFQVYWPMEFLESDI